MVWQPDADLCEECDIERATGTLQIGKHAIRLCAKCAMNHGEVVATGKPKKVFIPVEPRKRGRPRKRRKNSEFIQEVVEYVKKQPGGIVTHQEVKLRFPDLFGPTGRICVGRTTKKLRSITTHADGTQRFVVYEPLKSWTHPYVNCTELEMLISKRLGNDWYLPGSKNSPRSKQYKSGWKVENERQKSHEDRIQKPFDAEWTDLKLPDRMKPYQDLIKDIIYRMTHDPNRQLVYTYKDLTKIAGVTSYKDFGMMLAIISQYIGYINNKCGFRIKMKTTSNYHLIVGKRKGA